MEKLIYSQQIFSRDKTDRWVNRRVGGKRYRAFMKTFPSAFTGIQTNTFRNLQDWYQNSRPNPRPSATIPLPSTKIFRHPIKISQPSTTVDFELKNLRLSGLDLIFIVNLFLVLILFRLFFFHSFGLMGVLLDNDVLNLPQGLFRESLVAHPSEPAPRDELIEFDHNQFTALEVSDYQLQPGDTLGQIAIDHELNMDTLISFNQIKDVRRLQIGQEFKIPNRDGLLHKVQDGDRLAKLADEYGSNFNAILDANSLVTEDLTVGQALFIPGARMNSTDLKLVLGELFIYPTRGRFTSGFGYRHDPFTGEWRFHNGIDLANSPGTSVRAAMAGTVVHVEKEIGNYGRFIIIQHPGGFQSLYAHLDSFEVDRGEYIAQGAIIGRMGNTGRSTGSHLHFSIIRNGVFEDPLRHLN